MPDLAATAARLGAALRARGVPVTPDQCARFARAVGLVRPLTADTLYWAALATLTSDPAHAVALAETADMTVEVREPGAGRAASRVKVLATDTERLASKDFGELTPDELAALREAMRRLAVATPPRRTRRFRTDPRGTRIDLRATLRAARRTGGFPVVISRRNRRWKPRRLVVLCDISGSMEPYARALLQVVYCAAGGSRAEVFTFATRLTRLTRALHRRTPGDALERAGRTAPDWAGGTRIGECIGELNRRYDVARGAVVLVVSDGWETGDARKLGREMARLSRVAYRIVWANPRTASPSFQPLAAGMAAAWPYCDAVVSAHSLAALDKLLAALAQPRRAIG